ncbi:MAG TPA: hypothetical protein VFH92_14505, partial [Phenylobacterium sp.]|nr:hypothetical protein [Phenylobacterium sp.]
DADDLRRAFIAFVEARLPAPFEAGFLEADRDNGAYDLGGPDAPGHQALGFEIQVDVRLAYDETA